MKTKINVIIVVIISLFMLGGGLFFAINSKNQSVNYFANEGYIINNTYDANKVQTNKEYFESEQAYQGNSKEQYTFKNTDGKKVTVSEESYVHYSDGSVMALKDGVAIDLEKIDLEILNYYNIFEGSVLTKKNNRYEINNLNDTLIFDKLLFKISDNKYLLAAENIVISFSDGQTVSAKDYIEIEYANEDVIRLYNDKLNYQTISSNLYILSDNIKIDVAYKTVSKNDVDLLAMVNMVINANDNIEVVDKKEEVSNGSGNNTGENNTGGANGGGSSVGGGTNPEINNPDTGTNNNTTTDESIEMPNIINPGISDKEDEEETSFVQPKFNVTDLVTTVNGVSFSVEYVDPSEVLEGSRVVEIIENSTGISAFTEEWSDENISFKSFVEGLKANSAYTINIRGQYSVDDQVYDRVFISKIFRTQDYGVNLITDYVSEDEARIVAEKMESSAISGFSYDIFAAGIEEVICSGDVNFSGENDKVYFPEQGKCKFSANTNYTVVLKNLSYNEAGVIYPGLTKQHKFKTLKQSVDLNSVELDYDLNYSNDTLKLNVNNVQDVNGGVKSYVYRICSTETTNPENLECLNPVLIKTSEKNSVTIPLIELEKTQQQIFKFDVEIQFDDNEKTVIHKYDSSPVIDIGEDRYPKVVNFIEAENTDVETVSGTIVLDDPYGFIGGEQIISQYKVVLREKTDPNIYTSSYDGVEIYDNIEEIIQQHNIIIPNTSIETYTIKEGDTLTSIAEKYNTTEENLKQINNLTKEELVAGETIKVPMSEKQYYLPVSFRNVRPGTNYDMYVYIYHNNNYFYIGYQPFELKSPESIEMGVFDKTKEIVGTNELFAFSLKPNKESVSLELLEYINIELYSCENDQCLSTGYKKRISSTGTEEERTIINQLKNYNESSLIKSSDFDASNAAGGGSNFEADYDPRYTYKIVATGYGIYGQEIKGEYPIQINLKKKDTNEDYTSLEISNPSPVVSLSATPVTDGSDSEKIIKYQLEFYTKSNQAGESITTVDYWIYSLEALIDELKPESEEEKLELENKINCDSLDQYADILDKTKIANDSLNLSSGTKVEIEVNEYGSNSKKIERGKAYCIRYSGNYQKTNGSQAKTNSKFVLISPKKASVTIAGYLSNYKKDENKSIVTFRLSSNDIDKAASIYLVAKNADNNTETLQKILDKDKYFYKLDENIEESNGFKSYSFEMDNESYTKDFYLMVKEERQSKLGQINKEITSELFENINVLYKFNLDEIKEFVTKKSESEEVKLVIPKDELGNAVLGQVSLEISNLGISPYKVSALVLTKGESEIKIPIEIEGETIKALLSVKNIQNGDYGDIITYSNSEVSVDLTKISLLYDSNVINNDPNKKYFVTGKGIVYDNSYWQEEIQGFTTIKYLSGKTNLFTFEELKNKIYSYPEKDTIGYRFEYDNGLNDGRAYSFIAHFHEAKKTSIGSETINIGGVQEVVSIDNLNITYTTNSANISFSINGLKNNDKMKYIIDNSIEKEITNSKEVKLEFSDLSSGTHKFTLQYSDDNGQTWKPVYSNQLTSYVTNISLNSNLIELEFDKDSNKASYESSYWNLSENTSNNTISFKKIINTSSYLKKNFILKNDEQLIINAILIDQSQKQINLSGICSSESFNEFSKGLENINDSTEYVRVACSFNIPTDKEISGTYNVVLKPQVGNTLLKDINVGQININKQDPNPKLKITKENEPVYGIEMIDNSGNLTDCFPTGNSSIIYRTWSGDNEIESNETEKIYKKLKYYVEEGIKNTSEFMSDSDKSIFLNLNEESKNKMYYFILSDVGSTNYFVSGQEFLYTAIPFSSRTKTVNYETYFDKKTIDVTNKNYRATLLYCTKDGDNLVVHTKESIDEFDSISDLSVSSSSSDHYISVAIRNLKDLYLEEDTKYISYQQTINNSITLEIKTVEAKSKEVQMVHHSLNDGTYELIINIPVDSSYSGRDVSYAKIILLDENKEEIRSVQYNRIN